jgi:chemotaxis protein CheD
MIDTPVIYITQGECRISLDPHLQISTILGSCVAACLWDSRAGVGGMNHFLLPFGSQTTVGGSLRYGVHSMETLINGLLGKGASRKDLQAKLFGGAMMSANLGNIGGENARFARDFLKNEDIPCVAADLEGVYARRVLFRPTTGQARVMTVRSTDVGMASDVVPLMPVRRKNDCLLF